jgi:hypothetical protein
VPLRLSSWPALPVNAKAHNQDMGVCKSGNASGTIYTSICYNGAANTNTFHQVLD